MQIQIIITIIVAIGAAAAWYFLVYKKKAASSSAAPVASSGWTFQYSPGMPAQMTKASDGSYFFDLPPSDGVHYVVERAPSLQLGQLVAMSFNVSRSFIPCSPFVRLLAPVLPRQIAGSSLYTSALHAFGQPPSFSLM